MNQETQTTLSGALGILEHQLTAFVGAGGKSTALQRLAVEQAISGGTVATTTTTAMFAYQLASLGPLVVTDDADSSLTARVKVALRQNPVIAVVGYVGADGKARGLTPTRVDTLWRARLADSIVVEADGSRGLPLKAFGTAEPQLPEDVTTVVVVAGLDSLGSPFDEGHVHRAALLTSILGVAEADTVTPELLARAVALQVARVRNLAPSARVVVMLNKADSNDLERAGTTIGARLLRPPGDARRSRQAVAGRPDRVVIASLWQGTYRVA
jgi:probable selenium-dependent hydroxylase accessory protein YqeC